MEVIKVLLVEDDAGDHLIIKDLLEDSHNFNYTVHWSKNYTEAMEVISQESFDVALVDFRLGHESGLDLLTSIKKEQAKLPVILLTGIGDTRVDLAAMQIGAADFLMKGSIDTKILERSIRYAIKQSSLIDALNELTIHDQLTGLYNRREMDRILDQEIERFDRYQHPFCLIMLDIDHFKSVNDNYGHPVGDQVLKWLSQILESRVRKMDRCIRYGGEEFAVILPETTKENGLIVAEWLQKNIAETPFILNNEAGNQDEISITISLGVADLLPDGGSKESLIAAADQALYQAKNQGRNRVILAQGICELNIENSAREVKHNPPNGREKNHSPVSS